VSLQIGDFLTVSKIGALRPHRADSAPGVQFGVQNPSARPPDSFCHLDASAVSAI